MYLTVYPEEAVLGKANRIVTLFAAVVALTLAPFWCGIPGLSPMHGAAMAAPTGVAGDCAGHACHDTPAAGDTCCVYPDTADIVAMPQVKASVATVGHPDAAIVSAMVGLSRCVEMRDITGFSPGPPVPGILHTLVNLQVLFLI